MSSATIGLRSSGTSREGIEADRPFEIGGVDVDKIVGAGARDVRKCGLGEIAVRVKQREPLAGNQVLADEIGEERALAGAGLADDVGVPAAFVWFEHDGFARHSGANAERLWW